MSYSGGNEDRLTSLPEEVISHILSLMPTKFAVQTSILSKRWRYCWMTVTNLDFDDRKPFNGLDCFSKFVDRVLNLCKTSKLKSFRLNFFRYPVPLSSVLKWIDKAVELKVCELLINVRLFELPLRLFTCKTLTKLSLASWTDYDIQGFVVPSLVILPALKTLDITVKSEYNSVNAFRLIHGCPVLESLSLVTISRDCEDYNFNIPTLKRLEITTNTVPLRTNKVFLKLPNLEYLFVGGNLVSHFVMEDLSSLVEATVSLIHVRKNLSLPKFPNLTRLELKGLCSGWLLAIQFLETSSTLEHFCIEEPNESYWIEPQRVPTCMLSKLITMKITRCKGRECDIRFLEYMLRNAEVLKTLTITCGILRMKDEMALCARLLKFPRASRYCEIHFVGKWLNSTGN
ncbi:hypothetical protein L1887_33843 [Cichorium endivia]|nr:hypothetical protein L1887_33843 [Cichorium endivia]